MVEAPISLLLKAESGGYRIPNEDGFRFMPFPEVRALVARVAGAFKERGWGDGTRIAICGDTCYEWKVIDQAIQWIGGVVVPIYPTLTVDQVRYILDDAECEAAFCQDPDLRAAVDGEPLDLPQGSPVPCANIELDAPMTIVYTSGTTGKPKGAILTHRNWAASNKGNIEGLLLWDVPEISMLAFLPLAHVAGYASILALTDLEGTITFSSPDRIAIDSPATRPTFLAAVPRIYERIFAKIQETANRSSTKAWIFKHGEKAAIRAGKAKEQHGKLPMFHGFWERILFQKIRQKLGFDQVLVALTGAAPLRPQLLYFFQGVGINIVEAYGLTECAGLLVSNQFDEFQAGTVGKPMPGSNMALAEDGEILLSGPTIFQGYQGMETDCLTTINGEIWLQTGDIGEFRDGNLAIIDRKKELEILDTGKNVAPAHIEEALKEHALIEQACVIGHGRKYCTALIEPAFELLNGPPSMEHFARRIAETNKRLAPFEQIKQFHIIQEPFSQERNELTPTLKKKRRIILENYASEIEAMYSRQS